MNVSTSDLDFASLLSEVFHELSNATQNLRVRTCPKRNIHVVCDSLRLLDYLVDGRNRYECTVLVFGNDLTQVLEFKIGNVADEGFVVACDSTLRIHGGTGFV